MSTPVVRACLTTPSNHWTNAAGPSSTDWLGGIRTASSVTSRPSASASFDFIASRKARPVPTANELGGRHYLTRVRDHGARAARRKTKRHGERSSPCLWLQERLRDELD